MLPYGRHYLLGRGKFHLNPFTTDPPLHLMATQTAQAPQKSHSQAPLIPGGPGSKKQIRQPSDGADEISGVDSDGKKVTVSKSELEDLKFATRKAMMHLFHSFPFWALLIERCNVVCTLRIQTACVTPSGNIYYNPFFFQKLSHPQRMFVLAHEVAHVAFKYFARLQNRDHDLFNKAQDYLVNFLLNEDFSSKAKYKNVDYMPDKILYSDQVGHLTSEEIYEMLRLKQMQQQGQQGSGGSGGGSGQQQQQQQQQQNQQQQQQQQGSGGGGQKKKNQPPVGSDARGQKLRDENPDTWNDLKNPGGSGGQGGLDGDANPEPVDENGDPIEGGWDEVEDFLNDGELMRERGGDAPENYDEWDSIVSQAATRSKMQGNMPAHLEKFVEDFLEPKVHWTKQFQAALGQAASRDVRADYSFMRPNRRTQSYGGGIVLPSLVGSRSKGVFAVDTSGSMYCDMQDAAGGGATYMEQAISEVEAIRKQHEVEIYLMNCDAGMHRNEWIKPYEPMPSLKGGGGTDFRPIFEHIEEEQMDMEVDFVCVLTDGWGNFPEKAPPYDVVWIAFSDQEFPYGDVIRVET